MSGYNYIERKGRIPGAIFSDCGSEAFYNAWLMGWPRVSVYDGGWFECDTENSHKYTHRQIYNFASITGLKINAVYTDNNQWFSLGHFIA